MLLLCVALVLIPTVQVLAQFTVQPASVVQAEGLEAVFECLHPEVNGNTWIVNGDNGLLPNGTVSTGATVTSPARLTIPATPGYNNTVVQCRVTTEEGGTPMFVLSGNATLQVQDFGPLTPKVTSPTSVTLSWNHIYPGTVDYYVNVTQEGSVIIKSELVDNTLSQYTFTSPPNSGICQQCNFTVTPTNGMLNSTSSQQLPQYLSAQQSDVIVNCLSMESQEVQCSVEFDTPLVDGVCDVTLEFSHSVNEDRLLPELNSTTMTVTGTGERVYQLVNTGLLPNRLYSVDTSITIGSATEVINSQNTSTHDIASASVTECSYPGALNTSCTFVDNTTATGYMALVSKVNCEQNIDDTIFLTVYNTNGGVDILNDVGEGNYTVTIFDIESNGLPIISVGNGFTGAATVQSVTIQDGGRNPATHQSSTPFTDGSVDMMTDNRVCIRCPESCLALIHSCDNPDVLISMTVESSGSACTTFTLPYGQYSVALFGMDGSTQLARHPDKILSFTSSSPTTVPTTSIICILLVACILMLV